MFSCPKKKRKGLVLGPRNQGFLTMNVWSLLYNGQWTGIAERKKPEYEADNSCLATKVL